MPRNIKLSNTTHPTNCKERGGAIIEYIIVTAFSAVFGIAVVTFMATMLEEKIDQLATELNMEEDFEFDFSFFNNSESE